MVTCWRIERLDGQIFRLTENTRSLVIDGFTYSPAGGFMRSAYATDDSLSVSNLEAVGFFDDDVISETELRAGLFTYAQVFIFAVNWADLSQGSVQISQGRLGEARFSKAGIFTAELRGLAQALSQKIGRTYSAGCRLILGEQTQCRVPLEPTVLPRNTPIEAPEQTIDEVYAHWRVADPTIPWPDIDGFPDARTYHDVVFVCVQDGTTATVQPTYDFTVGAQTTDGTAVFEAVEAWTRVGTVSAVTAGNEFEVSWDYPDPRLADDVFQGGVIKFETGNNAGSAIECKAYNNSTGVLTAFIHGHYLPEVGDRITVHWGCDHTINGTAGCASRFANALNYGGEPFIPGSDQMLFYPDAGGGSAQYQDVTYSRTNTGSSRKF